MNIEFRYLEQFEVSEYLNVDDVILILLIRVKLGKKKNFLFLPSELFEFSDVTNLHR
jgi:hypothetical protein